MPSQISQVAPGHMLNSIAPATGGKSDRRDADTARQEGSFQSILGEMPPPNTDKPDVEPAETAVELIAAVDAEQDADKTSTESPDTVFDDDMFSPEHAVTTPNTVQVESDAAFEFDDTKVLADAAPEPAADKADTGDTEIVDRETAQVNHDKKGHANGIPAWLVTSLAAEKPLQNEKPSGETGLEKAIASVTKESAAPVAEGVSRNDTKAQAQNVLATLIEATHDNGKAASTEAELRNRPTDDAPRNKDVTPFIRNAARNVQPDNTVKAVPGAEIATARVNTAVKGDSAAEKAGWAHPRSEEPLTGFRSTRTAEPTAPQNFKAPVQPQMPPQINVPLKAQNKDISDVRWVSDVSFTADAPAQELPATSRLQQAALLQQPDLPRNIAIQLAQALRQAGGDRPMELVLNPAELGRVRISMQASEGAMTVQVLADRPETLDLMRRNIDTLAQEFHDMGFGSADFAFGQSMAGGDSADSEKSNTDRDTKIHPVGDIDDAEHAAARPPSLAIHSDRVDIRL